MDTSPLAALGLGLASIPHCMGMCGPVASAAGGSRSARLGYQFARLVAYGTLGALAARVAQPIRAALGSGFVTWGLAALTAAALVLAALRLLRARPVPLVPAERLLGGRTGRSIALAGGLGLATGLLPCGALYGALALAATGSSPVVGAASMVAFGGVSGLGLLVSSRLALALARSEEPLGRRSVAAVLVVGAALVLARPLLAEDDAAPCHTPVAGTAPAGGTTP